MKKSFSILCLCLSVVVSVCGQSDDGRDSVRVGLDEKIRLQMDDMGNNDRHNFSEGEQYQELTPEEQQRREEFVKIMRFEVPKFYEGPPMEEKSFGRILPGNNDYAFHNFISLSDNAALVTGSTRQTYPVGMINQIDMNLMYAVNDWLSVSGGIYTAKYGMLNSQSDFGFNASIRFKLHDRLYLNTHGRYSVNMYDRNRNFGGGMEGIFPQTSYGAGLEFKITDKVGIGAGVVREFNPFNRKWTNRPYAYPVFYK